MPTEFARLLESTVGANNTGETSVLTSEGRRPVLLISPSNSIELSECLTICARERAAVVPAGGMSWLDCGNPLARADVVLSLRRMNRIVDYSPPDLTLTVEAGLTLRALNRLTGEHRQWLPLDPPDTGDATAGAIAACNSSGALRRGFGTPRDYVIGLRLAHADGKTSKSGGRVVKNVAGYDLNKLYVGSFGTLAVVTELTFKLRPLPDGDSTLIVSGIERGNLLSLARGALQSGEIVPSSAFLLDQSSPNGGESLAFRFVESGEGVEHQVAWVKRLADSAGACCIKPDEEGEHYWRSVVDLHRNSQIVLRLSLPLSEVWGALAGWLGELDSGRMAADLGTGTVRIGFGSSMGEAEGVIHRLRSNAMSRGGSLFIEDAPFELKRRVDAWGYAGPTAALMKAIKLKFDPERLLNPGRFVNGI